MRTEDESLGGFLGAFATEETTTRVTLPAPPVGEASQHFFVVDDDKGVTALINVIRTRDGLSVDVRAYLGGPGDGGRFEADVRLIGFTPGRGTFVPGRFPLGTVVVGERPGT